MQISIAQELPTLPPFRQQGGYTAFVEGWALYAEQLGEEVGFYQDPYNDLWPPQDEMLRAIRLVVDTGLHSKKWTREQVVQFFHDHSAIDEVDVQSETDRYIVWPGQALGYKIGQLKILALREQARKELGPLRYRELPRRSPRAGRCRSTCWRGGSTIGSRGRRSDGLRGCAVTRFRGDDAGVLEGLVSP